VSNVNKQSADPFIDWVRPKPETEETPVEVVEELSDEAYDSYIDESMDNFNAELDRQWEMDLSFLAEN
jgi:hypothetical protein